ncbi:MAG: SDR family NAD(P)-dependent oxidoreductase [Flavobacteriales bacterium]
MSSLQEKNIVGISRNGEKLSGLAKELGDSKNVRLIQADITQSTDRDRIFEILTSEYGKVDILIHNAGKLLRKPLTDISTDDLQEVYATNLIGPALLSTKLFPLLRRTASAEPSHIIHISSMGGVQGSQKFPGLAAYSSSKAALIGMAECMAEEWRSEGIRSNVLAIGSVSTEMFNEAFPGLTAATTPEAMAEFIADFALNGHRLFNGKLLQVSNSTP